MAGTAESVTGARFEHTMGAVVVGPAAGAVRRVVGPVAWCALEHLAASPPVGHGDEDTVAASVRSLAGELGVSKHMAHRALVVLRARRSRHGGHSCFVCAFVGDSASTIVISLRLPRPRPSVRGS
jgi:hypothetical protein